MGTIRQSAHAGARRQQPPALPVIGAAQCQVRAAQARLDDAVQWVDLHPLITGLEEAAPGLTHPALEQAAYDHAAFLASLNEGSDLLRRQVLLVLREPHAGDDRDAARDWVMRRVDSAARALAAAEITVTVLDGGQASAVLGSAVNPFAPPHPIGRWAAPDQVVTGSRP